ncbi:class II fumarate hydratase [SAR202 cluster bacterium AD-804-J14_MRT_500m]|nr:class II fumarate hydratase [SAR202 cluster bacterium AD-804-J14_MRT_500m]
MAGESGQVRVERDSMGDMDVPVEAYYGASTMRAVLNFQISSMRFNRPFIRAIGLIKNASARVNTELGILDPSIGEVVAEAAAEVAEGRFDDQFVVDIFQTGSGTSTNMNANEVIANRATELMGGQRGSRLVHPNDHINICQSSNDVIPTAVHLAALIDIQESLRPGLQGLKVSLSQKSEEFWSVIKTGRTHLQDATPIRLGQEFRGYVGQVERSLHRLSYAESELSEVALGGTAVGTGVNAHRDFASKVCGLISQEDGVEIHETENHFQAQNAIDGIVETSGVLRTIAVSLNKIANDIRWLGSGPRAGLGELALPEVQPGSSIMPGKVNPVISESVIQAMAEVIGNDQTICLAGLGSYFELNLMMPVAAHNLLQSIHLLATSSENFSAQCVKGLKATGVGPQMVERGLMLGTALAPALGYDRAAEIAKTAAATGASIREVVLEKTDLTPAALDELLNLEQMTEPGLGSGHVSG